MMDIITNPPRAQWPQLTVRPHIDNNVILPRVQTIIQRVRQEGDTALVALAREIDGVSLQSLRVTETEMDEAQEAVPEDLKEAIRTAINNIAAFHVAQRPRTVDMETTPGVRCVQSAVPIQRVGLYIPGGSAPLFSTVLMLAVPARVAGCSQVVMCTPTDKEGRVNPAVLYAARAAHVHSVYKAGGAQAIAAMAYGTESVPRVDKIFGPGNQYVTAAKQLVSTHQVAIDMPAGPSEVLVMADETAVPAFVAADLLSQAEHGPDSQVILLAQSQAVAEAVLRQVQEQLAALPRHSIAARALENSRVIVFTSRRDILDFSNLYGPEHLIISMDKPWDIAHQVTSAGSVFIGNYTPESAGDYASGTNHTLPTGGWTAAYSGVNLDSFMRKITYQEITRQGLQSLGPVIETMATAEGLDAHRNAVTVRLKN